MNKKIRTVYIDNDYIPELNNSCSINTEKLMQKLMQKLKAENIIAAYKDKIPEVKDCFEFYLEPGYEFGYYDDSIELYFKLYGYRYETKEESTKRKKADREFKKKVKQEREEYERKEYERLKNKFGSSIR